MNFKWQAFAASTPPAAPAQSQMHATMGKLPQVTPEQAARMLQRFEKLCELQNTPWPIEEPKNLPFPSLTELVGELRTCANGGTPDTRMLGASLDILRQYGEREGIPMTQDTRHVATNLRTVILQVIKAEMGEQHQR